MLIIISFKKCRQVHCSHDKLTWCELVRAEWVRTYLTRSYCASKRSQSAEAWPTVRSLRCAVCVCE